MTNDYSSYEGLTDEEQSFLLSGEYAQHSFTDLIPAAPQSAKELCTPTICGELERIYLEDGEQAFMQHQQELLDAAKKVKGISIVDVRSLLKPVLKQAKQLFKTTQQAEKQEQARQRREAAEKSCPYPDFTVDIFGNVHLLPTYQNFKVMCEKYDLSIQMDVVRRQISIPEEILKSCSINGAENTYSIAIQDQCVREGIRTNVNQIQAWIKAAADENRINPIREYLERLAQNYQVNSADTMQQFFDCLQFHEDVTAEQRANYECFYTKWLVQCVAMAHNEQGKNGADFVLVLQSKRQGVGKSSFFRQLCNPPELDGYFLGGRSMNLDSKDSILENTACWICELGELESTTKAREMSKLKSFLTETKDCIRAPYDVKACNYPRFTCYAGTVNEPDFLREEGRRFAVLPIIGVDLPRLKNIDINRLWAEAYTIYQSDPNFFRLTKEERDVVVATSEEFRMVFSEEQFVRDLLNWEADPADWNEYTASEIARVLDLKDAARVGKALNSLGYEKTCDVNVERRFRVLHGVKKYNVPPLKRSELHTEHNQDVQKGGVH